jgi:hypothetical protein
MELLLLFTALLLVSLAASTVHRHRQAVAWDRELDQAFGTTAEREIPRHGHL